MLGLELVVVLTGDWIMQELRHPWVSLLENSYVKTAIRRGCLGEDCWLLGDGVGQHALKGLS